MDLIKRNRSRLIAFFSVFQIISLDAQSLKEEYTQCAVNYVQTKQYAEAIEYFSRVIELDSADVIAYFDRGFTKELMNDFEGAISDYSLQIGVDSLSIDSYFLRGMAKEKIGDSLGAIADYSNVIELEYDNSDAHFFKGRALATYGKWKAGLDEYSIAIKINPEHELAYAYRAWALIVLGDKKGALKDLEWSKKYAPDLALSYLLESDLMAKSRDFKTAFQVIEHACEIGIPQFQNYPMISNQKHTIDAYKQVVLDRKVSLKMENASEEQLLHFSAACMFVHQDEIALQVIEEILAVHPKQQDAIRIRAQVYMHKKLWRLALDNLNLLLNTDSPNPEDYLRRSEVYLSLNQLDESCLDYQHYVEFSSAVMYHVLWKKCKANK